MTASKLSHIARLVSLFSFIIGTGIFALYYFSDAFPLLSLGLGFIVIAGLINLIFFVLVIKKILATNNNKRNLYLTCGLILLNLPIMLLYCWLTSVLLNTMRITFVNETTSKLTDIKIFGCEEKHISKLEPREKKLVWVSITRDCSVNIEFKKDGKLESENVLGYTSTDMGKRVTHKIGWENAPANY